MDLVIRQLSAADLSALSDLFERNNVDSVTRNFDPFPLTAETAQQITCTPEKDRFYGAFVGERQVGLCMLRGWNQGYEVPSFGVMIDQQYQHQGIGKQLTSFAIQEARRAGCEKMRLSVYASNTSAMRLYLALGFEEIERTAVQAHGRSDQKIVMVKEL